MRQQHEHQINKRFYIYSDNNGSCYVIDDYEHGISQGFYDTSEARKAYANNKLDFIYPLTSKCIIQVPNIIRGH